MLSLFVGSNKPRFRCYFLADLSTPSLRGKHRVLDFNSTAQSPISEPLVPRSYRVTLICRCSTNCTTYRCFDLIGIPLLMCICTLKSIFSGQSTELHFYIRVHHYTPKYHLKTLSPSLVSPPLFQ